MREEKSPAAPKAVEPGVRPGVHHRAEIGGKGEKRPGQRLGGAVSRKKRVVAHPASGHDFRPEQRQDDMAAADHQGARPVKDVERGEHRAVGSAAATGNTNSSPRKTARQAPAIR